MPDSAAARARLSDMQVERARMVWEALAALTDTDPRADAFAHFDLV